jgi:hypothetical protein
MRKAWLIVACATSLWPFFADAQEKKDAPQVKLLTPAECAKITRRSTDEYYVEGPITIGILTMERSSISRDDIDLSGVGAFEVITRSCYAGKAP